MCLGKTTWTARETCVCRRICPNNLGLPSPCEHTREYDRFEEEYRDASSYPTGRQRTKYLKIVEFSSLPWSVVETTDALCCIPQCHQITTFYFLSAQTPLSCGQHLPGKPRTRLLDVCGAAREEISVVSVVVERTCVGSASRAFFYREPKEPRGERPAKLSEYELDYCCSSCCETNQGSRSPRLQQRNFPHFFRLWCGARHVSCCLGAE